MSIIKASDITFGYDGSAELVFEHANFQIDSRWKLGLTGRNGRGKTTLLKLLMGQLPYSGSIVCSEQFDYFPFAVANPEDFTIEVLRAILPDTPDWQIIKELSAVAVADDILYQPFDTLSKGQQTKILIAAMFLKAHHFLLIDEPTNHLDAEGRRILSDYLRRKQGFLVVSHDRTFLDDCIDHILAINKATIEVQQGNFSSWWENKQRQDAFETARNAKLKKDINRLQQSSRQKSNWSDRVEKTKNGTRNAGLRPDKGYIGHKAAKMMKRAAAIENRRAKAAAEKAALMKNIESSDTLQIHPAVYHADMLCRVSGLSVQYGDQPVFSDLSFAIHRGDRIALWGVNGSGKSSILKLLCGQDIPHTGTVETGSGLRISYVSQNMDEACGTLSEYAAQQNIDLSRFLTILRKMDFSRALFEYPISTYSAGQKKKVLLAGSLCTQAHLYVWDEPLNYIDVLSRIQIEDLILDGQPTMIFVEHDQRFIQRIATAQVHI